MRVIFLGGTGPVGLAGIPHLLAGGHEVAVAHTGAHEPGTLGSLEHLHGQRDLLLAPDGAVERWRPDAIIDTFAGGATAEKAQELGALAERIDAGHLDDRFQGFGRRVALGRAMKGAQDRRAYPTPNRRFAWTPTWTPLRPHCMSALTIC